MTEPNAPYPRPSKALMTLASEIERSGVWTTDPKHCALTITVERFDGCKSAAWLGPTLVADLGWEGAIDAFLPTVRATLVEAAKG